jgi:hypothetical protein
MDCEEAKRHEAKAEADHQMMRDMVWPERDVWERRVAHAQNAAHKSRKAHQQRKCSCYHPKK